MQRGTKLVVSLRPRDLLSTQHRLQEKKEHLSSKRKSVALVSMEARAFYRFDSDSAFSFLRALEEMKCFFFGWNITN